MRTRLEKKPTNHRTRCIVCNCELKKNDVTLFILAPAYLQTKTGRICSKHLKVNELKKYNKVE